MSHFSKQPFGNFGYIFIFSVMDKGSEGTVEFIKYMNTGFDIFNCDKEIENNIYKSPIKSATKRIVFNFLDDFVEYINGLKLKGQDISTTRRRIPFFGFKNNAIALKLMYEEFVETGLMDKISTTGIQQDLLESFFSRMRSKGGFNSNPTQDQFIGNFRRILLNQELTSSALANCIDNLQIMHIPSTQMNQLKSDANYMMQINIEDERSDEECDPENEEKNKEEEIIRVAHEERRELKTIDALDVASLAGLIESSIQRSKKFSCEDCAVIFELNTKIDGAYFRFIGWRGIK